MESIDVGRRLSRPDLILLGAERRTDRDVDWRSQPHRILVTGVEADDRFRVFELTGEDVLLVRNAGIVGSAKNSVGPGSARGDQTRAKRGIEGVLEIVLESVVADRAAQIIRPS